MLVFKDAVGYRLPAVSRYFAFQVVPRRLSRTLIRGSVGCLSLDPLVEAEVLKWRHYILGSVHAAVQAAQVQNEWLSKHTFDCDGRKHCSMHCIGCRSARASYEKSLSRDLEASARHPKAI